jgi:hypothetical protein
MVYPTQNGVNKLRQSLARKFIHSFCKLDRFKLLRKILNTYETAYFIKKSVQV